MEGDNPDTTERNLEVEKGNLEVADGNWEGEKSHQLISPHQKYEKDASK